MIDIEDENISYNLAYLVCAPKYRLDYINALDYTVANVCIFSPEITYIDRLVNFCVSNKIRKVILIDYLLEYKILASKLKNNSIEIYIYSLVEMGALSSQWHRDVFDGIMSLYKYDYLKGIAFSDKNAYLALKKQVKNVFYLPLDFPPAPLQYRKTKTGIGILSDAMDPMHSFYNTMSAIRLNDMAANISKQTKTVKEFKNLFRIKTRYLTNRTEVLAKSEINTYINFTNNDYRYFFQSMDLGTPCLLGNQQIIDPTDKLYDLITVKSDDDILEIASKINEAKKQKQKIIEAYKDFRKKHTNTVQRSRSSFLPEFIPTRSRGSKTDILLSVIVPIYNTEKYLKTSVESIIRAKIPNMEVLLINDGSKDRSGAIAKELQKKYPELIRYIEQENHGLGNVRNVGLKEAKGLYITSVDSDDTINKNTFKEALKYLNNNIDIVIYDWQSININTNGKYTTSAKDGIGDKNNNFEDFLYASIAPSACNKIIKKSLYDEIGFDFLETKYEDLSLNPLIIIKAKDIAYIRKPYYNYLLRQGSIMRSDKESLNFDMVHALNALDSRLKKICEHYERYDELYFYIFFWRIEDLILNRFYSPSLKVDKSEIQDFYRAFLPLFKKIYSQKSVKTFFASLPQAQQDFFKDRNEAILKKRFESFAKEKGKNNIKLLASNIYGLSPVE